MPPTAFPSPSIRRKSGKSEESRKQAETELTPITEEFIFSTKRPKRPRPKTKAASSTLTAAPTSAASSSTHPSTTTPTPTVAFPTPALLPTPEPTTVRPYRPVFTTPNRKIVSSAATKSPKPPPTRTTATTLTTPPLKNRKVTEPIPVSEAQMTGMQPSTRGYTRGPQMHTTGVTAGTTSGEHMVNYKGITMSEDEFLKQLVRIVEAHQVAINKIEEQVGEERRRGGVEDHEHPAGSFRKQGPSGNFEEGSSNAEMEQLERQRQQEIARQVAERQQKEREELEWQQEIARQEAERQRKEEEMRRQQEYAQQMAEMQRAQKEMEWQREIARQKAEMDEKEKQRQVEIARQMAERQRQEEELLRQQEVALQEAERQKKERERQKEIARQVVERKKQEEVRRIEKARKKSEMEKKERERQQEIARQHAERQRKEEEARRQEEARLFAERQKKERERQEEIARQMEEEEKRQREEAEKEEMRKRKIEEERLRKEEEQRIEAQRKAEEERRIEEQLAAREVENQSTVVNPAFGMHIPGETQAGEHSTDYYGYSTNSDATKTVLAGLMSMSSRLTSTEPPQLEIIHFTAPPPTPSSPANEWVTSPHSWRPPPDMQTNVLEWSRTPIPSTGTSELPSTVTSECDSNVECAFSYEDDLLCPHPNDATRYLQCTPMIGRRGRWTERMCPPNLVFIPSYGRCGLNVGATPDPYATQSFVIPRLPSDPEYVHWQGNKELQPHVAQLPYQPIVTLAPYQPVLQTTTLTPILRTIDEFPRDLLPPFSYIHNTIPPSQFEPDQDPNMDLSVINPLFPRVQPDFLMPFGKFRDGFVSSGNSFMGSIIKPAIKKIAMDQTESFLDRILSDEIANETRNKEKSASPQLGEDGWRKAA
ncbi:hypothetical protein Y032_0266g716 [Ancylostoma ceylanicum]|nr:hypothetical protein Y032_0266g716 [Ancylostoma ceylanicum]